MTVENKSRKSISVVVYASNGWNTSLGVLRIVDPYEKSGINLIKGNMGDVAYPELVSQADIVLFQRDYPRYTFVYERILKLARTQGKPVVFDLDDLLLNLPEDHPDRLVYYYTDAVLPMVKAVAEVDLVTASTLPLCDCLRQFNPNVRILPNYLDDRLWRFIPPRLPKSDRSSVVITYMGSESHTPDLQKITPVLLNLLRRYGNRVRLDVLGVPLTPELDTLSNVVFAPLKSIVYKEFVDYFMSQSYDVAIAPLGDNLFNRCKSGIKFLEYSALGIPGVYSRLDPYFGLVENGVNGYLASTLDEWEEYLIQLIENPDLRYEMAQKAQETVKRDWLLSQHAHQWLDVYSDLLLTKTWRLADKSKYQELLINLIDHVEDWQNVRHEQYEKAVNKVAVLEQDYLATKSRLDEIYNSTAWTFIQFIWRTRLWFFPAGSRREQIGQQLKKRVSNFFVKGLPGFFRKIAKLFTK